MYSYILIKYQKAFPPETGICYQVFFYNMLVTAYYSVRSLTNGGVCIVLQLKLVSIRLDAHCFSVIGLFHARQ